MWRYVLIELVRTWVLVFQMTFPSYKLSNVLKLFTLFCCLLGFFQRICSTVMLLILKKLKMLDLKQLKMMRKKEITLFILLWMGEQITEHNVKRLGAYWPMSS